MRCILMFALAAACASPPLVDGGEIRNDTGTVLHHVQISFEPTKRLVFANQILPGRAFAIGFSPREMQARYADLMWHSSSGQHSARLDAPSIPSELDGRVVRVIYTIHADGRATVEIVPDS